MSLSKELLGILACPKCRGALTLVDEEQGLLCDACAVVYPVRDGIPVMLIEEAVPFASWEAGERAVCKGR